MANRYYTFIFIVFYFSGLEIWPNLSSFTITLDTLETNRVLICKSNEPIQWYFKQYDGTLLIKKVRLI